MSLHNRILTYDAAINEALHQLMENDERVFIIGQGVKSPWYVGKTTKGLYERFGERRVIDTPVSENAMTGAASGAALAGLRPIIMHPRMDFMVYAADQIVNEAANWRYMFGGKANMPLVIRPIINRGGEQAAQHSQALHAWFAHIPGIKVVMPATPYDAKGLLVAAVKDEDPIMYIDDRALYQEKGEVPEELFTVEIGKASIIQTGKDVTVVSISSMLPFVREAAEILKKEKLSIEIIDIRTVKPFDEETILRSVKKTGRIIVADPGWKSFGASAEISAWAAEKAFRFIKAPILRVALPDCPAPSSCVLEKAYYPDARTIVKAVKKITQYAV
ncbi:MAG: alpha-ketoacid dehydrogenase subunit beta [Candidatus Jacksonbacteria bacterium]|nr:alpha-ketoacid dehydrogenase subunit beta [Candidatus Jacksonbacteria bacterium]